MGHGKWILQAPKSLKVSVKNECDWWQTKDHFSRRITVAECWRTDAWMGHFPSRNAHVPDILRLGGKAWLRSLREILELVFCLFDPFCIFSPFFFLYFFTAKTGPKLVLSGRHTVAVLRSASKRPRVQTPANEIACRSTVQHRSTVDSMLLIGSSYQPRFQELFREKAFAMGFKGHSCPGSWHPMTSENVTGAWQ